jgi:hypothetical protein
MFVITASAFAHDAWIEKKDGKFIVVYGHGDNILNSAFFRHYDIE